ncbi:hypothetical protein [Fervidobacterium sp.]
MRRTGWMAFLVVLAALLVFTSCVKPQDQNQGEQTPESTDLTYYLANSTPTLHEWYWFQDGEMFSSAPKIDSEGIVTAVRNDNEADQTWKAQLIRFYEPGSTEATVTLWFKANKTATIKVYFGEAVDPWWPGDGRDVVVSTDETSLTLHFGPLAGREVTLPKLSLELGKAPGLQLQVKLISEEVK